MLGEVIRGGLILADGTGAGPVRCRAPAGEVAVMCRKLGRGPLGGRVGGTWGPVPCASLGCFCTTTHRLASVPAWKLTKGQNEWPMTTGCLCHACLLSNCTGSPGRPRLQRNNQFSALMLTLPQAM